MNLYLIDKPTQCVENPPYRVVRLLLGRAQPVGLKNTARECVDFSFIAGCKIPVLERQFTRQAVFAQHTRAKLGELQLAVAFGVDAHRNKNQIRVVGNTLVYAPHTRHHHGANTRAARKEK